MKKIIVVVAVLLLSCSVSFARDISVGTIQLSGGTSLQFNGVEVEVDNVKEIDSDVTEIDFSGHYYFMENIGFGLLMQYENEDTKLAGGGFDETTLTVFGPQVIGQFPINETTNFYLSGHIGFMTWEGKDDLGTYVDADGTSYGVNAGISIFPIDPVSIDLGLKYMISDGDDDISNADIEITELGFGVAISVYF